MVDILVADESALNRISISNTVADMEDFELVADTEDRQETLRQYRRFEPDIIMIGTELEDISGIKLADQLGLIGEPSLIYMTDSDYDAKGDEQVLVEIYEHEKVEQAIRQAAEKIDVEDKDTTWEF